MIDYSKYKSDFRKGLSMALLKRTQKTNNIEKLVEKKPSGLIFNCRNIDLTHITLK